MQDTVKWEWATIISIIFENFRENIPFSPIYAPTHSPRPQINAVKACKLAYGYTLHVAMVVRTPYKNNIFFQLWLGGKGGSFPKIKNSQYILEKIVGISVLLHKPRMKGKGVQTHKKRKD